MIHDPSRRLRDSEYGVTGSRKTALKCVCAHHNDGSVTTFLCPVHADDDPCLTIALVTGRRRKGSIVNGVCTNCGWSGGTTASKTAAGVTGQGPRDVFDKAKAAAPTHDFSVDLYDSGPGSLPAGGGQGFRKATCTRCGAKIEMQSVPSGGWYATYPNYPCLTDSTASKTARSEDYQKGFEDGYRADYSSGRADTWDESYNGNWEYADGFNAGHDAAEAERRSRPRGEVIVGDGFAAFSDPDDFLDAWLGSRQDKAKLAVFRDRIKRNLKGEK